MGPDLDQVGGTRKNQSKLVKELKTAAQGAPTVFLATDPDREGEAIALAQAQLTTEQIMDTNHGIFYDSGLGLMGGYYFNDAPHGGTYLRNIHVGLQNFLNNRYSLSGKHLLAHRHARNQLLRRHQSHNRDLSLLAFRYALERRSNSATLFRPLPGSCNGGR
jgi:hypothetical protein